MDELLVGQPRPPTTRHSAGTMCRASSGRSDEPHYAGGIVWQTLCKLPNRYLPVRMSAAAVIHQGHCGCIVGHDKLYLRKKLGLILAQRKNPF